MESDKHFFAILRENFTETKESVLGYFSWKFTECKEHRQIFSVKFSR